MLVLYPYSQSMGMRLDSMYGHSCKKKKKKKEEVHKTSPEMRTHSSSPVPRHPLIKRLQCAINIKMLVHLLWQRLYYPDSFLLANILVFTGVVQTKSINQCFYRVGTLPPIHTQASSTSLKRYVTLLCRYCVQMQLYMQFINSTHNRCNYVPEWESNGAAAFVAIH